MNYGIHYDPNRLASALRGAMAKAEPEIDRAAQRVMRGVLKRIQAGTYWRNQSGKLAASFTLRRTGLLQHTVSSPSPVAKFLDKGTAPHRIDSRTGSTLRYVQSGVVRFAKTVWHPGTRATNFVDKEQAIVRAEAPGALVHALEHALTRVGL